MFVVPGERTGKYRLGITNMIVFDHNGESKISYEDYAAALIDEVENKQFIKQQFSIGY
jgi:putative NADH-flavin reductase